jgi:hypothetical protein
MADQNQNQQAQQDAARRAAAPAPANQQGAGNQPAPGGNTTQGGIATAAPVDQEAGKRIREADERFRERRRRAAEDVTKQAEEAGRLPANTAVANPAKTGRMNPSSGAFVEDQVREGVPADHPSVDSHPRDGTSAIQNGQDFNEPRRIDPSDPEFMGQGLDLSVYGGEHARR